ncbi:MAG TPA: helix-turn-helix transcriptional regulator [Aromatoleum sp.]|uniref:AraC family transcriptional regulator n=1 Tax=Aromatoleum sp. TaxID=2307007 RepID=UPI002B465BD1|nr:helix-turn-helix transcriptional regulator [Aromatoleum sp.]HJV27390.1 helix-turn-helix transcriptional regulator [Aromatoleum sp.]
MKATANPTRLAPQGEQLPAPIHFRVAQSPANAIYPTHKHAGGEFVYAFRGVMEVKVQGQHLLAPPQYGIWLPPEVEHIGLNRKEVGHCSVYIAKALCGRLPRVPCALSVDPLIVAMLERLRERPPQSPATPEDERFLQVLVDQLASAPCAGSYLPSSTDPALASVLQALEARPEDNRPLAELARRANTTERTLIRRCQRDLGMSLSEWRQRLRILRAMPLLESGRSVESVALDLGYSSSSAFITMFRKLMHATPAEFAKSKR